MTDIDRDAVIEAAAMKVRAAECEAATGLIPWDRMEEWAKDLQRRHVRIVAEVVGTDALLARLAEVEAERDALQERLGDAGITIGKLSHERANLAAENARLRQDATDAQEREMSALAQLSAAEPVVKAAEAHRDAMAAFDVDDVRTVSDEDYARSQSTQEALMDAVDAYRAGQKAPLDRPESTESQDLHPGDARDTPDGREAHRAAEADEWRPEDECPNCRSWQRADRFEVYSRSADADVMCKHSWHDEPERTPAPADPPGLDEAIEAAARVIAEAGYRRFGMSPFAGPTKNDRLHAEAAVRAAAPALRAGALREAADAWYVVSDDPDTGDWLRERSDRIGGAT